MRLESWFGTNGEPIYYCADCGQHFRSEDNACDPGKHREGCPDPAPEYRKKVCAWCLETLELGATPASHGICDECYEQVGDATFEEIGDEIMARIDESERRERGDG